MLDITGVMVLPAYFASTLYLWKISKDSKAFESQRISPALGYISGIVGSLYAVWLIYAAGLNFLLLEFIFLALGIPVFIWSRHQQNPNAPYFSGTREKAGALLVLAVGVIALINEIVKHS